MAQTIKDQIKDQVNPGGEFRSMSHGRGGAGNINANPNNTVGVADLKTPTLKSQTYTTGRGGQGMPEHCLFTVQLR